MQDTTARAVEYFDNGYSCSQSVLMAFATQLELTEESAARIASAFGGGIARSGETCGAVSGSLMALGLKFSTGLIQNKESVYQKGTIFLQKFEGMNGSVRCRQLIGYDISKPQELLAARETQSFKKICPDLVRSAAEILRSMLEEDGK